MFHNYVSQLAASLVSQLPVSPDALQRLQEVFLDNNVTELWVILANGQRQNSKPESLDIYPIITNAALVTGPIVCSATLTQSSAALRAMETDKPVVLRKTDHSDDWDELSDWTLIQEKGLKWMITAGVCCKQTLCNGLLGAILAAGPQDRIPIDANWLDEWSTELGHAIAHASITVLEQTLDVLSSLFPPQVVENLIAGAISVTQQSHTGGQQIDLRAALSAVSSGSLHLHHSPERLSPTPLRNSNDSDGRASLTEASPFAVIARHGGGGGSVAHQYYHHPSSPTSSKRGPGSVASPVASPRASLGSIGSLQLHQTPSLRGSLTLQHYDRTSSAGHLASALRQASLQSDPSLLFTDAPMSPANSEILGFEDILADDAMLCAAKTPSASIDRHLSPPLNSLVEATTTEPVLEPVSLDKVMTEQDEDTVVVEELVKEDHHHTAWTCADEKEQGGSVYTATALPQASPPSRLSPIQESSSLSSRLSAQMPPSSLLTSPANQSLSSSGSAGKLLLRTSLSLEFASSTTESLFGEWHAIHLVDVDRNYGLLLTAIQVALLSSQQLSRYLAVFFTAIPALMALLQPSVWVKHRIHVLMILRVAAVISFCIVRGAVTTSTSGDDRLSSSDLPTTYTADTTNSLLGEAIASLQLLTIGLDDGLWQVFWLAAHSLCYRLPLNLHLPLQLLCLWIITAAGSFTVTSFSSDVKSFVDTDAALITSSPHTVLLIQLVVGLLMPSLGVFAWERLMRKRFVLTNQQQNRSMHRINEE